jgi:hypothetical protein
MGGILDAALGARTEPSTNHHNMAFKLAIDRMTAHAQLRTARH